MLSLFLLGLSGFVCRLRSFRVRPLKQSFDAPHAVADFFQNCPFPFGIGAPIAPGVHVFNSRPARARRQAQFVLDRPWQAPKTKAQAA